MTTLDPDTQLVAPVSESKESKREFWLVLASLTLIYIVAVVAGNHRYVWFDELFTFDIAKSSSIRQLWFRETTFDCNPPASYLLSRLSIAFLGANPTGLRFPSMAAFYLGSIGILLYVRRKATLAFAALTVLLVWTAAPTLYYAVEARPYALIFLCFAVLLLAWDTAIRTRPRSLALAAVAISIFVMTVAHAFTAFTLLAFFVAEAVRCIRQRKADYPLWAAMLLPLMAVVVYLPLLKSCGGMIAPKHASYNTFVIFFEKTFQSPIIAATLFVVLLLSSVKNRTAVPRVRFHPEETVLFACLILLSPTLLIAYLIHHKGLFYERYGMTFQVAILILLALLLYTRLRANRWAPYAGCLLIVCFLLKTQVWHPLLYPAPRNASFLTSIHDDLPLVVGEGQVFMEMNQYESAPLLNRLYFLKDPQASMQIMHTNIFQNFASPDSMKKAGFPFPGNIDSYSDFIRQHRKFLYLGNENQWVFIKLQQNGAAIEFVANYAGSMPYFDSNLFLINLPPQ